MAIHFDKDVIFNNLTFEKDIEAVKFLAAALHKCGYVKEEFIGAVVEREKDFPTGIPSEGIKMALPHADYKLVNKPAISVAVLKKPVEFRSMEDPEKLLPVKIVIMLALDKPHGHLDMLQKLTALMKDRTVLEEIVVAQTKEEIYNLISPFIFTSKNE